MPEGNLRPSVLRISEVFGPTVQGEGPRLGERCGFVRLYGCNLSCKACDSIYARDGEDCSIVPTSTVLGWLNGMGIHIPLSLVVVTGGEPLLQQRHPGLMDLVDSLVEQDVHVQFETNGTKIPAQWLQEYTDDESVTFVVSPKVCGPLATDLKCRRIKEDVLSFFADSPGVAFKFVASSPDDVFDIAKFAGDYHIKPCQVWIMPEGNDADIMVDFSRVMIEHVLSCGFNMTTRLHLLLWPDDQRGK